MYGSCHGRNTSGYDDSTRTRGWDEPVKATHCQTSRADKTSSVTEYNRGKVQSLSVPLSSFSANRCLRGDIPATWKSTARQTKQTFSQKRPWRSGAEKL